ncbi:MAG: ABC transporter permease [Armatimonadetes bacterium]|nr:ABC transporter permease [Armatimonadota bacterium]
MMPKPDRESYRASGFRELPALVFLALIVSSLWILDPNFSRPMNLLTTAREMAVIGIMGAGMTMVILTAGIDLSVASVLAFSAAVMAKLMVRGDGVWPSVGAALAIGTACGAGNAFLINRLKIPPIITTLGTMGILRAGVTLYTQAKWIGPLPKAFYFVGTGYTPVLLLILVTAAAGIFLLRSRSGRYVSAVGGNEEAVRLSGVSVGRTKFLVYTVNGLLASVAGLIVASSMSSAQSNMATGYELNVIAAVVIGGTSINGGQGSVLGTVIGAAIIAVLYNALILLGVPIYWHKVITGAVILTAVLFDRIRLFGRS